MKEGEAEISGIKRYDLIAYGENTTDIGEVAEGDYVTFTDHESEIARLRSYLEAYILASSTEAAEVDRRGEEIKHLRDESKGLSQSLTDCLECEKDYLSEIVELRAEVESLRQALSPFAEFGASRNNLGSTSPKRGPVYSVHTANGESELTVEHFNFAIAAMKEQAE